MMALPDVSLLVSRSRYSSVVMVVSIGSLNRFVPTTNFTVLEAQYIFVEEEQTIGIK